MAKLISLSLLLPLLIILYFSPANALYNVLDYGAKANGRSDSARAFHRAWTAACGATQPATVHVPAGRFLISRAIFSGPCKNAEIKFLIKGTIVASSGYSSSGGDGNWIEFDNVEGVSINGGTLDGRGAALWACKLAGRSCPSGTTSLTFTNSKNILINGLTSINSELYHIVILNCQSVKVLGANIVASATSPNTDGIHVQMSTGVTVERTIIKTGDDCISIGPGTTNLLIEKVFCGPGHGISIGSLGKGQGGQEEGVTNVVVKSVVFTGTQNGLRIKTWGSNTRGYVKGVLFQNAVMKNVQNPIIIDQNYCPHDTNCPDKNSEVKVSQVRYVDVRGTSATPVAVNFDCSPSNPCSGIGLQDIKLTYKNEAAHSSCKHVHGNASGLIVPPSCL